MAVEFLGGIAATIGGLLFESTWRHFGYLIDYNSNLHDFQIKVGELQAPRNRTQRLVDEAKTGVHIIREDVVSWLKQADEITKDLDNLSNEANENGRCFNQLCPNLKTRYKVSKRAKEKTAVVVDLLTNCNFGQVFDRAPLQQVWSTSANNLVVFESRKSKFEKIVEALRNDNISIIGVYGTGGIGKTTIVNEVAKHVREQHLFENVVMAVVSQKLNVRKIQGEIADLLNIELKEETVDGRATRLRQVLMGTKSVLIILDDLWEALNFDAIGIPHGNVHKGCKIVLTSRNEDVYADEKISIDILSKADARNLFRTMAGDAVDSPEINPIASEIVAECAGFPIAIVTVARALIGKSNHAWNDALNQLKNSTIGNIAGVDNRVYESLKCSYEFLGSNDLRSCFLLCCLFKEDANISIGQLVRYGWGLKLFQSDQNFKEATDRIHTLVDHLKIRCLLLDGKQLDGKHIESIRMHDVIRDFAIWMASSGEHVFRVRHDVTEWTNENAPDQCTGISLLSNNITELPEGLDCPKLQILVLECRSDTMKIPGNFFVGMKELRVLDMRHMRIPSLSPLVQALKKLRTLCLYHCNLWEIEEISLIGELKDLEVLSFGSSNVGQLPKEIGELTKLRLLDLADCKELIIPAKVISKLRLLEWLYMRNTFVRWAGEGQDMGESNANFAELKCLSNLFDLEIHIPDVKIFPKDLFFENLIRFKVSIGNMHFGPWYTSYPKSLELRLHQGFTVQEGIKKLLKRAQQLILNHDLDDSILVLRDLNREGFANLKCLQVYGNNQIQHLVDTVECLSGSLFPILEKLMVENMGNLKEICHGDHLPAGSFSKLGKLELHDLPELINLWKDPTGRACLHNLRSLSVRYCGKLKSIFSQQVARYLGQLHYLAVMDCDSLEEVFADNRDGVGEAGMDQIVLHELKTLRLRGLTNLRSFCSETDDSLTSQQPIFNGKVTFPKLEALYMEGLNELVEMCPNHLSDNTFCNLRKLHVKNCEKLLYVGLTNMLTGLPMLEKLYIKNCSSKEERFISQCPVFEEDRAIKLLSNLRELGLKRIPMVWQRWWENKVLHGDLYFQNLSSLEISEFDNLSYVFSSSATKHLGQLQTLKIHSCKLVEEIVAVNSEEPPDVIVFPRLVVLKLEHLPKVMRFYSRSCTFKWPYLEQLWIVKCPKMKTLAPIPSQQNLRTDIEEGSEETLEELCTLPIQPFSNEKVFLPSLWILEIDSQPGLKEIWHNHLPADQSFRQLQILRVKNCEKLVRVVPSSLLPRLRNLRELTIEHCDSLETVLEGGEDPTEKVVFPRLCCLSFRHLSNLGSFCWGNHSIECPSLLFMTVVACPKLQTFSSGLLITPMLKNVTARNGKPSMPWKGDVNSTIQHFFKEKEETEEEEIEEEETEEEEEETEEEETEEEEE